MALSFSWDESKALANKRKHGVDLTRPGLCSAILMASPYMTTNTRCKRIDLSNQAFLMADGSSS